MSYESFKQKLIDEKKKLSISHNAMKRICREEAQDFMTDRHFTADAMLSLHIASEQFLHEWFTNKLSKAWFQDELLDLPSYMEHTNIKYDREKEEKIQYTTYSKVYFNTVKKKGTWVLATDDGFEDDEEWVPPQKQRDS
tara:strand:+ start:1247 stop:1663 length:417 start_codon:yes stop_codon:yes gene_type:complete